MAAAAPPPVPKHFALLYSYVPDILDKRGPYRAEHLRLAQESIDKSDMIIGGVLADPVDGALFLFRGEDGGEKAKAFAEGDPYVVNGLVTEWKVRPYLVPLENVP